MCLTTCSRYRCWGGILLINEKGGPHEPDEMPPLINLNVALSATCTASGVQYARTRARVCAAALLYQRWLVIIHLKDENTINED